MNFLCSELGLEDGVPPLHSSAGAMMQWHQGGRVNIGATLVRVDEWTITGLTNNEQVMVPSSWLGAWKVLTRRHIALVRKINLLFSYSSHLDMFCKWD